MMKHFKMENLECANCAAKMEAAICKLPGVQSASVNFMMGRLSIDADAERFDELMRQVAAICKKIEPDCSIKV